MVEKRKCTNIVLFVQMNNVTPEYCLDIIQKFEVSEENKKQNVLGIEGKVFDFTVSFVLIHCSGMEKLYQLFAIASNTQPQ